MRLSPISAGVIALATALGGCLAHHEGPLPDEPRSRCVPLPPSPNLRTLDERLTAAGCYRSKWEDLYRKVDGVRVHYIDVGEGPPVVLLHGFASSLNAYKGVIAALRTNHRVIALDLKGFGFTDRPEGDYSPAAQAHLVFALLDSLRVDKTDVVAHSWGSSIALRMALDKPARVGKLALYDAWVYEDQLPTLFHFARVDGLGEVIFSMFYDERADDKMATAFYDRHNVTEEMVESVEAGLARPGATAAALDAVRGQHYAEVEKRYPTIDKPVLLLWGREDKVTRLTYGERLSKELPRARLVVFPQCGHFPMIEAKGPSTRELVEFLEPPKDAAPPPNPAPAANAPVHPEPSPEKEGAP